MHHLAFPENLVCVAQHLEHHASLFANLVINAHHGGKTCGPATDIEDELAGSMCAQPIRECLSADGQRMSLDRLVRLRLAPTLFHLADVQGADGIGPCGLSVSRSGKQGQSEQRHEPLTEGGGEDSFQDHVLKNSCMKNVPQTPFASRAMPLIFVPPRSMSMRNMVQIFRNSGELFKRATAIKLH